MEREFTIVRRDGQVLNFKSDMSDEQALAVCGTLAASAFALDLSAAYFAGRSLSPNQIAWAHKMAVDATAVRPQVAADLAGVVALFDRSKASGLKRPKITIAMPDGGPVIRLKLAGENARVPGSINVTDDRPFGSNSYFGRIHANGSFEAGRDMTPAIADALASLAVDPAGFAKLYGQRTGRCCFCNLALTDERSTTHGYGPVCAKKWGLPWSNPRVVRVAPAA